MKTLVIGAGQVGTAIKEIVSPHHETFIKDVEDLSLDGVDVMHICYPDHRGFEETTKAYIAQYKPKLVIINSSVKVGTTGKCGDDVVYSPVRGRHPRLASEMKDFVKIVACKNFEKAEAAYKYFNACGLRCVLSQSPEAYELLKVISNVHMGLEIAWRQEVERMLKTFGIDQIEYTIWEKTYRDGCLKVNDLNLIRSIMNPDPIGGHCILPCTEILRKQFDSKLLDFIVDSNERKKSECLVAS